MTIAQWLRDPDYDTGVALYETLGTSTILKRIFASGESTFSRNKLHEELSKLAHEGKEVNTAPVEPEITDVSYVELLQSTKKKYGELAYLRGQIKHLPKEERAAACFKIVNEFKEIIFPAYEKLDYFKTNGKHQGEIEVNVSEEDPVKLTKRISTLRTYISKAQKGKLSKDKLPQWEAEVKEIERKLA